MGTKTGAPAGPDDERWMAEARRQAQQAAASGEVPVGAVVVEGDGLLAAAANRTITDRDPTAHAELVALRRAARQAGNHRLSGATLFVTLEPCIMCVGAIVQARLARVVFGCCDPKAGALGSVLDTSSYARLNHRFTVTGGVDEAACRALLQSFFQGRRASG